MGVNSDGTTLIDNGLFENIGAVTWDTTAKTSGFTAVSGNGYFCNTTGGAFTVTLPSSPSAGDVVGIKDYANTADTNNITIGRNGSKINGNATDYVINVEGLSVILVYIDGTQGWLLTNTSQASDISAPKFTVATGGTITTSGDFKIHTFTSPGTFCVSQVGDGANPSSVDHLVIAGGGGGAANSNGAGGAGAGGFRTSFPSPAGVIPISAQGYPITVGGGGAGHVGDPENAGNGVSGSNSIFSSITSAGGGGGGGAGAGVAGGSGGGAGQGIGSGGAGNTPPVSPSQGNPGAAGAPGERGAGGGGAGAAGSSVTGGNGLANSITGSAITRGGGGGGGARNVSPGNGAGGSGGGGAGACAANGVAGTVNTGGGGGGAGRNTGTGKNNTGGAGGSGIVIIRYKFQ